MNIFEGENGQQYGVGTNGIAYSDPTRASSSPTPLTGAGRPAKFWAEGQIQNPRAAEDAEYDPWLPINNFWGWNESLRPYVQNYQGVDYLPSSDFINASGIGQTDWMTNYGAPALMIAGGFGPGLFELGGASGGLPGGLTEAGMLAEQGGFGAGSSLFSGGGGVNEFAQAFSQLPSGGSGLPSWQTMFAPGETGGIPDWLKKAGLQPKMASTLMNLLSGGIGLKRSRDAGKMAERAAAMENPFGPERAGYAAQLRQLMSDPSQLTKMPGYQAGLQAVERKMASQGYLGSGNMMTALQKYGGDAFTQEATRLARLAGADFGPGGGSQLIVGNRDKTDLLSKALASLGIGVRGFEDIFGGP